MTIRLDARTGKWYYRFQQQRQDYSAFGFRTKGEAKHAELLKLQELTSWPTSPQRLTHKLTFAEAGQWFFENHAKPHKRSWKNDRARIAVMTRFFGRRLLRAITPETVEAFLNELPRVVQARTGQSLSDHTRNHYLRLLKAIYNRLKKYRLYYGENPTCHVEVKKIPRARVRFLYPSEEKLLTPAVAQDRMVWPYYYVALHTGMRIGEIARMRVEDVSISIRDLFVPNSKSSRSRHVPISEELAAFLEGMMAGKPPQDYALVGITSDYVSRRFQGICQHVGLPDFRFHDLRHTFAARLLSKGVPIYKVSKIWLFRL